MHGEHFGWSTWQGVAVVRPPTELDLSNANRLRDCCWAASDASGPCVVVDLSGTTFIDSTALGVFVGVAKRLAADGGWLRLASGDSELVKKVLAITELDVCLGNYPSVEKAIEAW